jgi:hypothetical protein
MTNTKSIPRKSQCPTIQAYKSAWIAKYHAHRRDGETTAAAMTLRRVLLVHMVYCVDGEQY